MGGVYIRCGSFEGSDKSCSPIQVVLQDLAAEANPSEQSALLRIESLLEGASDHIPIAPQVAALLLSLVSRHRTALAEKIAPITDPFEQIERDNQASPDRDPTDAKYGKSLGWKYYCILDVEKAFEVSAREREPVVLAWD